MQQVKTTTQFFPDLAEKARQAFCWTSFSPEVRGVQVREEYGTILGSDKQELRSQRVSDEAIASYAIKFKELFSKWLSARGNCASTMITGGSNFNVRRNEKANRTEQNQSEYFAEWRKRCKRALIRKTQPPKTTQSELERYRSELEQLKASHELRKEGNKHIRQAKKSGEDISQYLITVHGEAPHMIKWTMRRGFDTRNTLANIKRVEESIKILEQKETLSQTVGTRSIDLEWGIVTVNYEDDRIQIRHNVKPDRDAIAILKKNAFKWSPRNNCWQRQITPNAIAATRRMLSIEL